MNAFEITSSRAGAAADAGMCAHVAFPEIMEDDEIRAGTAVMVASFLEAYESRVIAGRIPAMPADEADAALHALEHLVIVAVAYGMAAGILQSVAPDDPSGLE